MEGASTVGRAVITAPDLAYLRGPAFVNIQLSVESATANAADGCIPRRWLPPGAVMVCVQSRAFPLASGEPSRAGAFRCSRCVFRDRAAAR